MTLQHIEHPLAQTISRLAELSDYLKVQLGPASEAGWIEPWNQFGSSAQKWTEMMTAKEEQLSTQSANIIGSSLLQEYQWLLIAASIGSYLVDRRVPNLSVENVQLKMGKEGEVEKLAFLTGRFAALPSDPAVAHPDAQIVRDAKALRDYLRVGLESHFGWVIEQLGHHVGSKARGLWLNVADRCASTLIWLMQEIDSGVQSALISQEIESLIRVPGSPLNNKRVGLFTLSYAGHTQAFLDRATCCYWYKTQDGDYCTSCPHRTKEDRNERLLKYMADKYELR